MALSYEYNKHDRRDVLRHAKELETYTIEDVYELELHGKRRQDYLARYAEIKLNKNKGNIGNLIQEIYFDVPVNNDPVPDIEECHVEIKVSPLENKPRAGLSVKERLVLGMINKNDVLPEKFKDSHIYDKCRIIILAYYIDQSANGIVPFKFPIHKSAYFTFPERDLEMMEQDYAYIRDCVNQNRYEDLHEHATHYLSPCTKNGGRAFSLKVGYMNQLFREYINHDIVLYDPVSDDETYQIIKEYDSILRDEDDLTSKTFEEIVLSRFRPYIGKTLSEIRDCFRDELSEIAETSFLNVNKKRVLGEYDDKAVMARTTYLMLGVKSLKAEEFEKSNIYVKTLKVNANGTMKEDISFPAFEFKTMASEKWEESQCYEEMVDRKFLWAIYVETEEGYVFKGATFWTLPECDIAIIKEGWQDIQEIIIEGVKFVKDRNVVGDYVVTSRGKNRILNCFPDTKNTNPERKEFQLCPAKKPLNKIVSIRPHARFVYYYIKSLEYYDTDNPRCNGSELPNGDIMTKQCLWFNNEYILEQLKEFI